MICDTAALEAVRAILRGAGDPMAVVTAVYAEYAAEARAGRLRGSGPIREIAEAVAVEAGVSAAEIMGRGKSPEVAHPRQEVMRRARALGLSYPRIARFWGMDHTSVMHGVAAAEARLSAGEAAR